MLLLSSSFIDAFGRFRFDSIHNSSRWVCGPPFPFLLLVIFLRPTPFFDTTTKAVVLPPGQVDRDGTKSSVVVVSFLSVSLCDTVVLVVFFFFFSSRVTLYAYFVFLFLFVVVIMARRTMRASISSLSLSLLHTHTDTHSETIQEDALRLPVHRHSDDNFQPGERRHRSSFWFIIHPPPVEILVEKY